MTTPQVLDGRYKLIKVLGAGGFGRTYIARDLRRPGAPPCVVKQLMPANNDPDFIREARRLFNTEAETLEKLGKHDQIPQLLAYFEEGGQFFLVQELIEGRSLARELELDEPRDGDGSMARTEGGKHRHKTLSEAEVTAILRDVLGILEFVHSEGVIHRDLKPDNLIRRKKDGKLVLIDFGAVKALQDPTAKVETQEGQSRFTVTIGTPGYMPSEQCAGRPNYTSDLYALGAIAIRALTGYEPTDLPTDELTGELVWRDKAKVSNGLAMVITRMVRYKAAQRYQSAREVLQALSAFVVPTGTPDADGGALVKAEPTAARSPRATAATPTRTTAARSQRQGDSGSWFLIAGLLAMVGIAVMALPNLLKSSSPAIVTSAPLASAVTTRSLGLLPGNKLIHNDSLKPAEVHIFTLAGKASQPFSAQLAGNGITFSILDSSGTAIASNTQVWQGSLPSDGDFQLRVAATTPQQAGGYSLRVQLGQEPSSPTRNVEIRLSPPPTP